MSDEALPGLGLPKPKVSELEAAVREQLELLAAAGHITPQHAGKRALAVELAQVIAHKRESGRASTIGNDARVLMELLDSFLPDAGEADEALMAAMAEWSEFVRHEAGQ